MKFPETRQKLVNFVIQCPFDIDRDYFVKICRRSVNYFSRLPDDMLKVIYMESKEKFFEKEQVIFDVGDRTKYLSVVMHGWIEIQLTNGEQHGQLDYLSKGSIIGFNGIIMNNDFMYRAVVISPRVKMVLVSKQSILRAMKKNQWMNDYIKDLYEFLAWNGSPQIDYIIRFDNTSDFELLNQIKTYKQANLWQ